MIVPYSKLYAYEWYILKLCFVAMPHLKCVQFGLQCRRFCIAGGHHLFLVREGVAPLNSLPKCLLVCAQTSHFDCISLPDGEHCTFTSRKVCSCIDAVKLISITIVLMSIYDICFETKPIS